jgi:hypothetical protein
MDATNEQSVYQQHAVRYVAGGYQPRTIEPGTKACKIEGWNADVATIAVPIGKNYGLGLRTGTRFPDGSHLAVVDVDRNEFIAAAQAAVPTPCGRVGQKGIALFARTAEKIATFPLKTGAGDKIGDFLATGSQVVIPPTIHPDTNQPYRWTNKPPLELTWQDLPVIDPEFVKVALTSRHVLDLMRGSETHASLFVNGNNVQISGDLTRRSLRCALDPEIEEPELREFKSDPLRTVRADRGKYVAAALTVVRAHLVAGAPGLKGVKPLAGFDDWSRLIRGALVWLGRADPIQTQQELRAVDPAVTALDDVFETWAEVLGNGDLADEPRTVKQLLECHQLQRALCEATGARDRDGASAAKVGKFLTRHQGRLRNGLRLIAVRDTRYKRWTWRLDGWEELVKARKEESQQRSKTEKQQSTKGEESNRNDGARPWEQF